MRVVATVLAGLALSTGASLAADWTRYSSDEFGFAGLFPVTPTVSTENKKVNVNGGDYVITMHTVVAKGTNGSICLAVQSIYNWPIDIEGELAADRDNFVKGIAGTVTSSKRTTASRGKGSDLPALLFDATMSTYDWRSLVVIDGQDVYEVAGGVPKGGETADLDRCVKNFALDSAEVTTPALTAREGAASSATGLSANADAAMNIAANASTPQITATAAPLCSTAREGSVVAPANRRFLRIYAPSQTLRAYTSTKIALGSIV